MATNVLGLHTFTASEPWDFNVVNDNSLKIDNGVKTAMQGRAAYNILHNSDFSIAQAGQNGLHGSTKYVCDRWISWDANATFGSGYITPGSPIDQHVSKTVVDINKTYTAAICFSDGTIKAESGKFANGFGSYALGIYCMKQSDSSDYVTVRLNSGNNIRWVALYEGSYTADTLPAYVPKGYAAELAECQRLFRRDSVSLPCIAGTTLITGYAFQTKMRINPTYTIMSLKSWTSDGFTDISQNISSIGVNQEGVSYIEVNTAFEKTGLVLLSADFSADL